MDKSWFGIGQPFFWPPFYQLFEEFALKSRASVHVLFGVLGTVDERHRGVILCQSSWGRCSMPWVGGWDVAHWMAVQIWMLVVFSFDLVVSSMYLSWTCRLYETGSLLFVVLLSFVVSDFQISHSSPLIRWSGSVFGFFIFIGWISFGFPFNHWFWRSSFPPFLRFVAHVLIT